MAEIYLKYKSVAAMLLVLSLMMYLLMLPFVSIDMQEALLPWYAQIQQNGAKAVSGEYAIYAPPYLYLLYLVNLLPGNFSAVVSIKLVSIIFNFIGAALFYSIVWDLVGQRRQALLAGCAFLLVPTVAINAALWGQCDIIYTTFLLASFQATLKNRPASAMMLFGVALSFKLQSVFFAPYLMVLVLRREIQIRHLLFAPVVYAVMMVPAWIAGRPAADLAEIYLSQGNYYHGLSMSAPSVWALLQKLPFITYGTGVIVGLVATIAAFLFILYRTSASGSVFRGGFHYYPGLSKPDRRYGGLCSHLLFRDEESRVEREHLGADCTSDRVVRADTGRWPWPPSDRDGAGVGHVAAVPARGHAVAQPAGDGRPSERVHLAASLGGLGADGRAAARAFHAGRHAAQPA